MLNADSHESSALLSYIETSNQFYQNLLGYKPEQTSLQNISEREWERFAEHSNLNPNSSGIYLPRNQTAIVRGEKPLSLFHEYFGHGLYCEQSLTGIKLVELEKRLLDEEKQEFERRQFTKEDLHEFRERSKTAQGLREFRDRNLGGYELFAIWTEYLLSGEFELRDSFERKYDSLPKTDKEAVDSVINFSEQFGDLATFYAQGMARMTTTERVKKLLEDIHGESRAEASKLILLSGSRNLFSDIDLFASSDYLLPVKNNWLDLVVFDEEDFERRVGLFEAQVTHPIMSGEFVVGDESYLQQKRKQLQEQPITEEAINHNFWKSKEQERFALEELDSKQREVHISYSKTYLANALALKEGKRIFTKEELLSFSPSGTNINLKGGMRKNAT